MSSGSFISRAVELISERTMLFVLFRWVWAVSLALGVGIIIPCSADAQPEPGTTQAEKQSPLQSRFSATTQQRINRVVTEAQEKRLVQGGVILVSAGGETLHLQAFGSRSPEDPRPMPENGIFDLASLTKPLATGYSIMKLVEEGRLSLKDNLADFFPEWKSSPTDSGSTEQRTLGTAANQITVEDLLLHRSGLSPFVRFFDLPGADELPDDPKVRKEFALERLRHSTLRTPAGVEQFIYSDLGFILLGEIVERASGESLNEYFQSRFARPLLLKDAGFRPSETLFERLIPAISESDLKTGSVKAPSGGLGLVHDPNARWLGGEVGHAGLFASAQSVERLARLMLDGESFLGPAAVRRMQQLEIIPASSGSAQGVGRSLAWGWQSRLATPPGDLLSDGFGHTGYTGTSLWIVPSLELVIVILTNRTVMVPPRDVGFLRTRLANLVASDPILNKPLKKQD